MTAPHHFEAEAVLMAEAALLGSILLDGEVVARVAETLRPEDFTRDNNAQIYRAALNLYRDGGLIDHTTLVAELENRGLLKQVGGRSHLALLRDGPDAPPTPANAEHYARIIREAATRLAAGKETTKLAADLADGTVELSTALRRARSIAQAIEAIGLVDEPVTQNALERVGLGYRCVFAGGVVLEVTRLRETRGELHGQLRATLQMQHANGAGPSRQLSQFSMNLSSLPTRKAVAKHFAELCDGSELRMIGASYNQPGAEWWLGLLEEFSSQVLAARRTGSPFELVGGPEQPDEPKPTMLLRPILWADGPTLIYAPGGTGKSTVAAAIAVSVQTGAKVVPGWTGLTCPVLVLDWEDRNVEWSRQIRAICNGAGIEPAKLHYRRMVGSLADQVEDIAAFVTENSIGLVVVDSVEPACGSGNEHETYNSRAESLFDALRFMEVASLLIDHVAGAELDSDKPTPKSIGGIRKRDRSRAYYELRAEKEPMPGRIELLLRDAKRNRRIQQELISLAIIFSDLDPDGVARCIRFERLKEASAPELVRSLPSHARMGRLLLSQGAMSDASIASALGIAEATVRSNLKRYPTRFTRLDDGRIGVPARA